MGVILGGPAYTALSSKLSADFVNIQNSESNLSVFKMHSFCPPKNTDTSLYVYNCSTLIIKPSAWSYYIESTRVSSKPL